ncbi:MAG TPA: hypothetical protein VFO27_19750 [Bryobacteraceae bacterium]|nr:hypothetical protein [Bryobacteraceae bacterium]
MKRRGCIDCRLIEPTAGQWIGGRCPRCTEILAQTKTASPVPAKPKAVARDATADRLRKYIAEQTSVNPDVWKVIDAWRARRCWPDWCFVPVCILLGSAQAAEHLSGELPFDTIISPEKAANIHAITAFAAWRVTQGIYRFDATIADALWDTPISGDLPVAVLYTLPEWCVYIETPGRAIAGKPLAGFFAHLDYVDENQHHLRIGLDIIGGPLQILPLKLRGSLPDSIAELERDHQQYIEKYGTDPYIEAVRSNIVYGAADLAPLISLLLYLCSTNAEIKGRREGLRPTRVKPTHTKAGARFFPPDQPGTWDVGFRLGAAIRKAQGAETRGRPGDGTHASPRAHIRRAHWHSFWTGPKATATTRGDRKLVLKWLPPMAVNVDDEYQPIPTIHPVKE